MSEDTEIRVAVLESEMRQLNGVVTKFDTAIDKLTDVANSIRQLVAVHEAKFVTFETQLNDVKQTSNNHEKLRWLATGVFAAVMWICFKTDIFSFSFKH